ncbi:signal peptidase I [Candidatus Woesearchaeota archaeon]|nr:signal peptidase I [Candidatus Woesearchaeota archaeon]
MEYKKNLKKIWHFIWYDNSWLSWIVNVIIAFLLVKFIIYPGFGLILGTDFPVVAVVSSSMEHNSNFDKWWLDNELYYNKLGIKKEEFKEYSFHNGFNKGDIMVLVKPDKINKGDVIVYTTNKYKYPIIHRLILLDPLITKGDNNYKEDNENINKDAIIGKAVLRIPILGWVKIWFTEFLSIFGL